MSSRAIYSTSDLSALDGCFVLLYDEIRRLAARLGWHSQNPTLTTTALAHEAYLKLRHSPACLTGKSHGELIGIFANAMRQILIDAARKKQSQKRVFAEQKPPKDLPIEDALTMAFAIQQLARERPVLGRIAEARFVLGMTTSETALALGLSASSVERGWNAVKSALKDKAQPGKI